MTCLSGYDQTQFMQNRLQIFRNICLNRICRVILTAPEGDGTGCGLRGELVRAAGARSDCSMEFSWGDEHANNVG